MKITYIANARMATEKAHGLQIMHMCRAFSQIGHDVTLIVPKRKNWIKESIWEFYGMEPCFKIIRVPIIDFIVWDRRLGNLAHWLTSAWFGFKARRVIEDLTPEVIYSRDPFSSAWTPRWVPNVFEAHTFPNRALWLYRWLWGQCDRIVTVTDGLKKMFVEQGVPEAKLRVAADAVDLEAFVVRESKEESRKTLNLPTDKFLLVYAGHLYPYKGIPDLMEAAQWLKPEIRVVIVGGRPDDLERTKAMLEKFKLNNVLLVGRVPHKDVPRYLHAADLAVMPYTRESHHVEYYSSPLKLFEYLAAGRAIISTDLPSVREVLDDTTAAFVPPENPKALADGINRLAGDPARLRELEGHSSRLGKLYTWKNRAKLVLAAMPKPKVEWKLTFWREYRLEINLALLALAIRLVYVVFFPQHTLIGGDSGFYLDVADWIRGKGRFNPGWPSFFMPGYPALLAAIRSVFGEALVWGRVVQSFLSAGTVFLAMLVARRWVSPYAAWVTGLIGALYVPAVLESGIYYTETTYTFFLTLSIFLFLRLWQKKTLGAALAAAAAFVAAGLVREIGFYNGLLLAAVFGVWKRSPKLFAAFIIPIVLVMGSIAVRNQLAAKNPLSGKSSVVPLLAKGYESTLAEPGFWQSALNPARLYLYPVGVYRYFRFPFRLLDLSSDSVSAKKLILSGDIKDLMTYWPQVAVKLLVVGIHWIILLFAALGAVKSKMSKEAKTVLLLIIFTAAGTIILSSVGHSLGDFNLFEPLARYRFPTEPLILIFAAAGIEYLSRFRDGERGIDVK